MHYLHGPTNQHIARTNHQRVAQGSRLFQRLRLSPRSCVGRLTQTEGMKQLLEALAVLCSVNHVGRGSDDGNTIGLQIEREFQWRLTPVLHDHAHGLFLVDDLQHILKRERLEIQAI